MLAFWGNYIFSQTEKQTNYVIADITVEGNTFSDPQTIITISGLKRGESITFPCDAKIQKAIKNLWQRHQFEDVQIVTDRITLNGIFLIIKVKEFPRVSEIKIQNNKDISTEDLLKIVDKNRGDIISRFDVYQIKQRIKRKYKEEGSPFARVEAELIPTDTQNYFQLLINIDEGIKYKVKSIVLKQRQTANHQYAQLQSVLSKPLDWLN